MGAGCSSSKSSKVMNTNQEPIIPKEKKKFDLLLLGMSGHGKSETGNTILQREGVFRASSDTKSVTKNMNISFSVFEHYELTVVDTPGCGDTDLKEEEANKMVMGSIAQAICTNPSGYHAFLYTVKFGARLGDKDSKAFELFQKILGKDFLKTYGIVLITCKDIFEQQRIKGNFKDFKDYCEKQKGSLFEELVSQCNNRVVLFDNMTQDEKAKHQQMTELMKQIENLPSGGKKYTNKIFELTANDRKRIEVESKKKVITEDTGKKTAIIIEHMNAINKMTLKEQEKELTTLLQNVHVLYGDIDGKDDKTDALKELLESVKKIEKEITQRIEEVKKSIKIKDEKKIEEEKRQQQEKIEELRKHNEELREKEKNETVWESAKKTVKKGIEQYLPGWVAYLPW